MTNTTTQPRVIKNHTNDCDMVGFVSSDGLFFRVASASGPMGTGTNFYDGGPLEPGRVLRLSYNYITNEYCSQDGWACVVERINRKSFTVSDFITRQQARIEF
jgi:hypothetical protein